MTFVNDSRQYLHSLATLRITPAYSKGLSTMVFAIIRDTVPFEGSVDSTRVGTAEVDMRRGHIVVKSLDREVFPVKCKMRWPFRSMGEGAACVRKLLRLWGYTVVGGKQ